MFLDRGSLEGDGSRTLNNSDTGVLSRKIPVYQHPCTTPMNRSPMLAFGACGSLETLPDVRFAMDAEWQGVWNGLGL